MAAGAADLHAAIMAQHAAGHDVVVLGFSQSASVATAEMRYLASLPADLRPGPTSCPSCCSVIPTIPTVAYSPVFRGFSCSRWVSRSAVRHRATSTRRPCTRANTTALPTSPSTRSTFPPTSTRCWVSITRTAPIRS
ncbi:PE-PPE domain protein [Mycobacterium kansasii]|uniref:PE-PPE domain protein n=1 Tax=Mycobacterium kansasii TaxID=1768 RepID=A0A1V3WA29_MYCKA|nr:PE-PPE domain protein [Mycobacterium kansasii]